MRCSTRWPSSTEHTPPPSAPASSLPLPSSSQDTAAGSPSVCSTNTHTSPPGFFSPTPAPSGRAAGSPSPSSPSRPAIVITSVGQALTHFLHPVHCSASTTARPSESMLIASAGQTATHCSQPMHPSLLITASCRRLLRFFSATAPILPAPRPPAADPAAGSQPAPDPPPRRR